MLSGGPQGITNGSPPGVDFSNLGPCDSEREPNDDRRDANQLAPARCGALSASDTIDYLTFSIKSTSSSLALKFAGDIRLRVEVRGASAIVINDDNDDTTLPFIKDEDYIVGVTAKKPMTSLTGWRVEVIEK